MRFNYKTIIYSIFFLCSYLIFSNPLSAQYKNNSLGFDFGWQLSTRPITMNGPGAPIPVKERSFRPSYGAHFGLDYSLRHSNNFWWVIRGNIDLYGYGPKSSEPSFQQDFDTDAKKYLGALLGFGTELGGKYYFYSDRFRPNLQLSMSYERLLDFEKQITSASCPSVCNNQSEDEIALEFLPRRDLWSIHLKPSIEYIIKSDFGMWFNADIYTTILFQAENPIGVVPSLGFVYYL